MSLVVTTSGHRLMVPAPRRPSQQVVDRRERPPDHAPEQATYFGDGERDQVAEGVVVDAGRVQRPCWARRCWRKVARLPRPSRRGAGDAACLDCPFCRSSRPRPHAGPRVARCWRTTVSRACANRASVMWRYQPVQLRTSYWSSPTSPLACSKASSIVQRRPATCTRVARSVPAGAKAT